ncbi:metallophosphoesterase [Clostridium sp.]|uniref:metallophosphoesterase n=1 Tax=Clostridium sp. TaxID=1506 RepID=UPI001A3B0078|nr:metallophosphoesterase [Clostridium sp.]MBK5242254.1 metallophosphoesterase [Clostridium sp.]
MKFKKKYIFIIFIMFLFILGGCGYSTNDLKSQNKIKSGKDITFYITTDIHYLSKDLTDNGEAFNKFVSTGSGKQIAYIDKILNAFTYEVKNKKPDILIISGDLTTNGEKKSHVDIANKFKDIEKTGTSVYVIPGNHDVLNPWARGFKGEKQYITDSVSDKDFSKIYSEFGYEEAILRDKNTLSYLAMPSEDVWLLMLDTNQYKNNSAIGFPQADGQITQETFDWIKKCSALAKEKGAKIITVMHHNLLNHSDVIQDGYTVNDNKEVIDAFQSSNLDLVLSGHIHIQDISSYKKDADKNINNFSEYTKGFFGKLAYDMAYKQLIKEKKYSKDEINLMSETMRILNLRYFSGLENLNSKDVINSEGFKLWSDSHEGFLKRYIMSIVEDKDTDDNVLEYNK